MLPVLRLIVKRAVSYTTPQLKEVHRFVPTVAAIRVNNPDRSPLGLNR